MRTAKFIGCGILLCSILANAPGASAQTTDTGGEQYMSPLSRTLSIGVAAGYMRFDSNFKFTDVDSGRSVFVDSEGTLGLPEVKTVPILYGAWRPSQKHGVGFGYFSVRRESELLDIDRNLGDLSVSGSAKLDDNSKFYNLTYNYTLFQDDRAFIAAAVGINVIDLEYLFQATGDITIGDEIVESGIYQESIRQIAPLPTFGVDTWFMITPQWAFGAKATFVAGDVSDVKAIITEASIRAKYTINPNMGLIFGIRYFDADIDISRAKRLDEINYGLDGVFLGIDVGY